MVRTKYVCVHCGSDRIQGTLPVWHRVNTDDLEVMDTDLDADFEYGFCENCQESDPFWSLTRLVECVGEDD